MTVGGEEYAKGYFRYLLLRIVLERFRRRIYRETYMTPRFKNVAQALSKLQHNLDYDADKLMKRIEEVDHRREGVFAKSHATVDGAHKTLDEIGGFLDTLEHTNAGPLENSAPRSSALMSGK